jgi:hypothetical protein
MSSTNDDATGPVDATTIRELNLLRRESVLDKKEIEILRRELADMTTRYGDLQSRFTKMEREMDDKILSLKYAEAELTRVRAMEENPAKLNSEYLKVKKENEQLQRDLYAQATDYARLDEQRKAQLQQAAEDFAKLNDRLMREKERSARLAATGHK